MAAAPADFRPRQVATTKLPRSASLTLELEPTPDIVAAAAALRSPSQRVVSFSLETDGNLDRARQKLIRKKVDMSVYNPLQTMNSPEIHATLLYADGRTEPLPSMPKPAFADFLIARSTNLLPPRN
jgi:phosphopantothenoylcysteine decarboxylase / phosphopantothenate---cysteine ligase